MLRYYFFDKCRQNICRKKEELDATSLPDSSTLLYNSKMSQKKQIFKLNILKKLLTDDNSCVSLVQSTRLLALPPFFLTDMKSGILYLLNSMLKKYDRSLGGIVIGYQNIKILMDENTGIIPIGTSEMEVNISVEFYIFQPKIGNYLQGVINKKSNNHIGCLVHQYFNATILKPEDVLYEDWICKDFNVDDKIIFKVIDLDFTTLLPYIEGIYDGKISLDKVESKSSGNCDINNVIATNINIGDKNELILSRKFLRGKTNSDKTSEDTFLNSDKGKSKCKVGVNTVDASRNSEENQSLIDIELKKKKKKTEKSPSVADNLKRSEEQSSNDKEVEINKILEDDVKKKKRKKKRKEDKSSVKEDLTEIKHVKKNEDSSLLPSHIHEKLLQVEDENSNDFVKFNNSKKEKTRKSQNEEPLPNFNKTNECLPSQEVEDNVLYSTQLEPVLGSKKMRISFCSPIPRNTPFEDKEYDKGTTSALPNNQNSVDFAEKESKKKHKKRKREKEEKLEDSPVSKKIKISNNTSLKNEETTRDVNGCEKKSLVQIMMEQLCQEQLNRVKEELNMSSSDKEERKKKEKKKKNRDMEQNESVEKNKAKSQLNGDDRKSELQSTFSELLRQNLQKVKEEFNVSDKESSAESKKKKVKKKEKKALKEREKSKVKESKNAQINCTNGDEKVSILKIMMDELHRQQKNKEKEELVRSLTENTKEKKKKKSGTSTQENLREKTFEALYEKLLNQAKNSMDEITVPTLPPPMDTGKKKKDSELSDVSTTSSRKKKSKHSKQKTEDCQQPSTKYKNGSMYDVVATPEKMNPDKSLFSDSEQSHISPVKKKKGVNGVEAEQGSSKVQNMLDEFYKEEFKRLKSESDRESQKGLEKKSKKKSKTERECQIPREESLYEKLLKDAKSLIQINEVSLPVKKEKKGKKK